MRLTIALLKYRLFGEVIHSASSGRSDSLRVNGWRLVLQELRRQPFRRFRQRETATTRIVHFRDARRRGVLLGRRHRLNLHLHEKGSHTPVIGLLEVGERMVMTLGALQLNSQEHLGGSIRHLVDGVVGEKECHGRILILRPGRREDVANHHIPGLVLVETLFEPFDHRPKLETARFGSTRQQRRLPDVRLMFAVIRTGQKFINQLRSLVGVLAL